MRCCRVVLCGSSTSAELVVLLRWCVCAMQAEVVRLGDALNSLEADHGAERAVLEAEVAEANKA